jgi:hypothetical protein
MSWKAVVAALAVALAAGDARAADAPVCFPLPPDYKVRIEVRDASGPDVASAIACLSGLGPARGPGLKDAAVTLVQPKAVPMAIALADAARALKGACARMRVEGRRLLVDPGSGRRCRPPSPKAPVRIVLLAAERTALITSAAVTIPPRSVLREPSAVTRLTDDHYLLSADVRTLAAQDPLAFVNEGAAFPNLFAFPVPGFVVTYVRPGGLIDRMGLKSGDIVMSINGLPLRTIPDAFAAYGALVTADVLVVFLQRGFERLAIVYEVR